MPESHVYDTYARTAKGRIMHFDVVIDRKDPDYALQCAKTWLDEIGEGDAQLGTANCCFCHSAEAPPPLREQIDARGYAILKLEGCPA